MNIKLNFINIAAFIAGIYLLSVALESLTFRYVNAAVSRDRKKLNLHS